MTGESGVVELLALEFQPPHTAPVQAALVWQHGAGLHALVPRSGGGEGSGIPARPPSSPVNQVMGFNQALSFFTTEPASTVVGSDGGVPCPMPQGMNHLVFNHVHTQTCVSTHGHRATGRPCEIEVKSKSGDRPLANLPGKTSLATESKSSRQGLGMCSGGETLPQPSPATGCWSCT